MSVKLSKGQAISLTKESTGLENIMIGLGWDPAGKLFGGRDIDIDASVICIDERGHKDTVVSYYNLEAYHGAINHQGDNLTGEGEGDDEVIQINLLKIPKKIRKMVVIINIYKGVERLQHFGKVKNCYVHVTDLKANQELVRYNIEGDYKRKTGIIVASLMRDNGYGWNFEANGEGVRVVDIDEMVKLCTK